MTAYYANEVAFEIPEDLRSLVRTVTALASPRGPETLLVYREPLAEGEAFAAAVERDVRRSLLELTASRLLFQHEAEIAGRPAFLVAFAWRVERGPVYTRQAHLALPRLRLMIVASAPLDERARCDEGMDHALATLRLRPGD